MQKSAKHRGQYNRKERKAERRNKLPCTLHYKGAHWQVALCGTKRVLGQLLLTSAADCPRCLQIRALEAEEKAMDSIPGYDAWKLASPPEPEGDTRCLDCTGELEVGEVAEGLCKQCVALRIEELSR